jgi:hypothetical protein
MTVLAAIDADLAAVAERLKALDAYEGRLHVAELAAQGSELAERRKALKAERERLAGLKLAAMFPAGNEQEREAAIKKLFDAEFKTWARAVIKGIAPIIKRFVEKRVAEIEQKGLGVAYYGVWQASQEYQRGALVTFDGSMWHCNETTRAKPGTGTAWTLAVKRGQEAK